MTYLRKCSMLLVLASVFLLPALGKGQSIVCDGSTDTTATLQAQINADLAAHRDTILPSGVCVFSSTLLLFQAQNYRLVGVGGVTGSTYAAGTVLLWQGAANAFGIMLDGTRDSAIEHLTMVGAGLRVDRTAAAKASLSTHNRFTDLSIQNATIGVQIGNASLTNNDMHEFRDVYILYCLQWCVHINNAQSKQIKFWGGAFSDGGPNVTLIHTMGGSFVSYAGNFGFSYPGGILAYLGAPTDTILIDRCDVEGPAQLLVTGGPGAAPWGITISHCRIDRGYNPTDTRFIIYQLGGPLTLQGNDMGVPTIGQPQYSGFSIYVTPNTDTLPTLVSQGNVYPNTTPFGTNPYLTQVSIGDRGYINPSLTAPIPVRLQ